MIGYAATETTTRGRVRRWLPGAGDASVDFLWVLLALTLVRGVIYAVLNPPFSSPDEGDHFLYVKYLATRGASGDPGREIHQPILYYALMVPAYWLAAGHSDPIQLLAIRLSSVPFVLGMGWVAWKVARLVAPEKPGLAVAAASIVALSPENTVISASASNDSSASFMGALLALLAARLVLHPSSTTALLTLAAVALALMTKGNIFPMVVVGLIALAGYAVTIARGMSRPRFFALLGLAALCVAVPLQTGGGRFALARIESILHNLPNWQQSLGRVLAAGRWPWLYQYKTFWATFLGDTAQPAIGWYVALGAMLLLGFVGLGVRLAEVLPARRIAITKRRAVLALFGLGLLLQWLTPFSYLVFLNSGSIGNVWERSEWSVQGRYLLPALVPLSILVVTGLHRLFRSHSRKLALTVVTLMLAFDANALLSLVTHYTWPWSAGW